MYSSMAERAEPAQIFNFSIERFVVYVMAVDFCFGFAMAAFFGGHGRKFISRSRPSQHGCSVYRIFSPASSAFLFHWPIAFLVALPEVFNTPQGSVRHSHLQKACSVFAVMLSIVLGVFVIVGILLALLIAILFVLPVCYLFKWSLAMKANLCHSL